MNRPSSSRNSSGNLIQSKEYQQIIFAAEIETTCVAESEDRTNGSVLSLTESAIIEASSLVDVVSSYEVLIFEICGYPNSNLASVAPMEL